MAGGKSLSVFHRAQNLKTNRPAALAAKRKTVSCKQGRFVHQPMRVVRDPVHAAFWNQLPGPMFPLRTLFVSHCFRSEKGHPILKISHFAGKDIGLKSPRIGRRFMVAPCRPPEEGTSGIIAPPLTTKSEPSIRILSVASTAILKTTRQLLLEQQGYQVYSVQTLAEVEAMAPVAEKMDLALIGHGFRGPEKRRIARAVNHHIPGLPILEMCFHSPEIPGADFLLTDSPSELIKAIKMILEGRRVRGFTD